MGLLTEGHPLSWKETKDLAEHVREHGIAQFINMYKRLKDKKDDILKFGDEIEYVIVKFDHKNKVVRLSLKAEEMLNELTKPEIKDPTNVKCLWRPEYAAYMIEGTPGKPYGGLSAHFNVVEANMKLRREEAKKFLEADEELMTVTTFLRLGCADFTWPIYKPSAMNGASRSLFYPQEAIYGGHPRFATLTNNIRMRRGEKVTINVPVFKDENTPSPFVENFDIRDNNDKRIDPTLPDHIYMDAMGFGMGCCCLQLTFQACNIDEARTLYDQLQCLCPIMLAITAASPVQRGYLAEIDCRWTVISNSVDCRTKEERGLEPLKTNKFVIPKSRYDTVDCFLSERAKNLNDVPVIYDVGIYKRLIEAGVDPLMAQHVAHLFIRDTVSVFSEKVHQDDEVDSDHFENIQSTNWQTMRFKPPPPNSDIGWRVEFRPCEVQFTDFENAAVVCFVVLMTRVILSYGVNLLMPISKCNENMINAQKMDAVNKGKFWFRKNIGKICPTSLQCFRDINFGEENAEPVYMQMTINEIINGKEGEFPGLVPLLNSYFYGMEVDVDTHCTIRQYLNLIQKRSAGEILTPAAWIRKFVRCHPKYKFDSKVSDEINYDLMLRVRDIQAGVLTCPELLGLPEDDSKTNERVPLSENKTA